MSHRSSILTQFTALLLTALLLPSATLHAQDQATPIFKVSTRIVVLDVVVTGRKGDVVTNLSKKDFAIFEDKQPQTILTFEPPSAHAMPPSPNGQATVNSAADLPRIGDAPVTIIVLDELNTGFKDMAYARYELNSYLRSQPPVLKQPAILLVVSNTKFQVLHDYTQSRADLIKALKDHMPELPSKAEDPQSGTKIGRDGAAAVERIAQTMEALVQIAEANSGTRGRKNVIWVGSNAPGVQYSGGVDPDVKKAMDNDIRRLTQTMLDNRITMYYIDPTINDSSTADVLGPSGTADDSVFMVNDPFSSDVDFNQFGPATGGAILYSRNDINKQIATVINNGANYYTLSYSPANKTDDPAKFRNIAVRLSDGNLTATTRTGYYAEGANADNSVNDTSLPATQRQDLLKLDLSTAASNTLVYNGLAVTAQKTSDPKIWQVSVATKDVSWSQDGHPPRVEVTAMAVSYDAKNKMLAHTARELTAAQSTNPIPPAIINFQISVETPPGTKRIRFILRDAVSGKIGTADMKP